MADFELHSTAPVAENADRRGRRKWRRFLLIYAVCLLLIGVVGCVVLYNYLDSSSIRSLPLRRRSIRTRK